jgi:hypothetical protein
MFKIIEDKPPQWLLDNIANSTDKLKSNYTLERLKLEQMICFCLLHENDKIVGFSGLQKFEGNTARVNSRCYITPEYRQYKIRNERVRYPWKYLAPYQINVAEKLGYTNLFWSTELYKRPEKTMNLTIKYASQYIPKGWQYKRLGHKNINGVRQEVCQILKS